MPAISSMFLVAQRELAARNMFETIQQQHLAIRSFSWPDMTWPDMTWPDISGTWAGFMGWLAQPRIMAVIVAWAVTFTVVFTLFMCLGFGPFGIIPGTAAAAFQSWAYGGFTPAGGIFATLTSVAMVGFLMPVVAAVAAVVATLVATLVWVGGAGR